MDKKAYLDGCEEDAEEGERRADEREVVVAVCAKTDTKHDGNQSHVGGFCVRAAVEPAVDQNGCHGAGRAGNLVERNRHHFQRNVRDGNVNCEQDGKCHQDIVVLSCEVRQLQLAGKQKGVAPDRGRSGVQSRQEPGESEFRKDSLVVESKTQVHGEI